MVAECLLSSFEARCGTAVSLFGSSPGAATYWVSRQRALLTAPAPPDRLHDQSPVVITSERLIPNASFPRSPAGR